MAVDISIDCEENEEELFADMTDDEKIDYIAAKILKKYKLAFMELAK